MKFKSINLIIISLSLLIISCNQYGSGVTKALKYAGDNRAELEQVLSHYSSNKSDSLKLRAACYLIEYMPYHRSYPAKEYDEYGYNLGEFVRRCIIPEKEIYGRLQKSCGEDKFSVSSSLNHFIFLFR